MFTVFIDGLALSLPRKTFAPSPQTEADAEVLDLILHRRVVAKLRWLLQRGEVSREELQAKAIELCKIPLSPYSTLDDCDGEDPILTEALSIARELIVSRMAAEGLPPPKGLDVHAKALVDAMPAIHEQARQRVEARFRAATEVLGGSEL